MKAVDVIFDIKEPSTIVSPTPGIASRFRIEFYNILEFPVVISMR